MSPDSRQGYPATPWLAGFFIALLLALVPPLFFQAVGEEGVYTIGAMEMWQSGQFLQQTTYGAPYFRPPMIIWADGLMAQLVGWTHVVTAARLVSTLSSLGLCGWLYWLCLQLGLGRPFALFSAVACLTLGDLFFYRGWLAYADPLLGFFTFGAMATLWVGAHQKSHGLLLQSALLVTAAMLTKSLTPFVFLGTVFLVLAARREHRRFLLSLPSLVIVLLSVAATLSWFLLTPQHLGQGGNMVGDIEGKLAFTRWPDYLRHLAVFPLSVFLSFAPVSLIAAWALARRHPAFSPAPQAQQFTTAGIILLLGFAPYWLAPQSSIRYLVPLYPLAAMVGARLIWRAGDRFYRVAWWGMGATVFLKLLFGLMLYPAYQAHFRGDNYVAAAHAIAAQTAAFPLYVTDSRSVGLNIVNEIDRQRFPRPLLQMPPSDWTDGFLLAMQPEPDSTVYAKLDVAQDDVYLLCRGAACASPPQLQLHY